MMDHIGTIFSRLSKPDLTTDMNDLRSVNELFRMLGDKRKELKRHAFEAAKSKFNALRHTNFNELYRDYRYEHFDAEVMNFLAPFMEANVKLGKEVSAVKKHRTKLQEAETQRYFRKRELDPATEPIPSGPFPKLSLCSVYPLRESCNYGETSDYWWRRCEFMKYDSKCDPTDPHRWKCTAPCSITP